MYLTFRLISLAQVTITQISLNIRYKVGTAYEGGIFRCKLVVDSEFPQKPPKGMSKFISNSLNTLY
jgi:ubiquitin-protein ligase